MIGQMPFRLLSGTRTLVPNRVRDGTISHHNILDELGEGDLSLPALPLCQAPRLTPEELIADDWHNNFSLQDY